MVTDKQDAAQRRIALVLAGGGAKGAYQFGVLKAFKRANVRFSAVAGTSVGGLNAYLFAADQMEQGEKLWRNLSFASVYPISIVNPDRVPAILIWMLAAARVLFSLVYSSLAGRPIPSEYRFAHSLAAALSAIPLAVAAILTRHAEGGIGKFFLVVLLGYLLVARRILSNGKAYENALVLAAGPGTILVLGVMCLLLPLLPDASTNAGFLSQLWRAPLVFVANVLLVILNLAIVWIPLCLVIRRLDKLADSSHVLSAAPLSSTLESLLIERGPRVPCYVASAVSVKVFDPDAPKWNTADFRLGSAPIARSDARWFPVTEEMWIPQYADLLSMPTARRRDRLLASAALPYGIIAPIKLRSGEVLVDGGVVDNVPFFPFVQEPGNHKGIDEIWVVILESCISDRDAIRRADISPKRWSQLRRKIDLSKYGVPDDGLWAHTRKWSKSNPPKTIPFRACSSIPTVRVIYPKRTIGGLIRGTLRFDKNYACARIEEGFLDGMAFVHRLSESSGERDK